MCAPRAVRSVAGEIANPGRWAVSSPSSDGVTRRQLLVRSGGAYLILYGALARAAFAEDAAADTLALSAARAATIAAVLAAVAADPGTGLAPDVVPLTAGWFGDYYAAAPEWVRGAVEDTLDRVEAEAPGFAALAPADALALLQGWVDAGTPDGRPALATGALSLASFRLDDEPREVGYTLQPA
jgi:hypothetical protein